MKKIVSIISIIIVIVVVFFALQKNKVPSLENTPMTQTEEQVEETSNQNSPTVTYDGSKFTPETVTIPKGTSVVFTNESDAQMWIGSDNHPTHTLYPGSNISKCFNGENKTLIFDQCTNGKSYTFTFTQVGSWGYHNHSNPRATGTIVVTE